jgi:hypothetical protein
MIRRRWAAESTKGTAAHDRWPDTWPRPLGLEMATCGESTAQWQSYNRKVFLCYELAQEFGQLYRDYGQDWKAPPKEKWWKWWKWWKRFEKK